MESLFSGDESERIAILAKAIAREVVRELTEQSSAPIVAEAPAGPAVPVITVGPVIIDTLRHETRVDGEPLDLKGREFSLLLALARGAGRVFTRSHLLELAWSTDAALEVDERTVDVHVRRLRIKLGRHADRIVTIHGIGYKLDDR